MAFGTGKRGLPASFLSNPTISNNSLRLKICSGLFRFSFDGFVRLVTTKNDFIVMNIKRAYVTELDENGLRTTVISETYDAVNNLSKENFLDLYYEKKS